MAEGGATTLANGDAMFAPDHPRKGAKSNEPYFPHQQEEFAFEGTTEEE